MDPLEPAPRRPGLSWRRFVAIVALALLAMIGFDLFLHAGILARFYVEPSPFLLPPEELFRRIPLGYAAFLLYSVLLVWLMTRLRLAGWRTGLIFGLQLGALIWGAGVLGTFSATSADPGLLLGWFLGETLQLGLGGAVAGSALAGARLGRLFLLVLGLVVALAIAAVTLQILGVAPAVREHGLEWRGQAARA